jgi:hypothetical protein
MRCRWCGAGLVPARHRSVACGCRMLLVTTAAQYLAGFAAALCPRCDIAAPAEP